MKYSDMRIVRLWVEESIAKGFTEEQIIKKLSDFSFIKYQIENNFWSEELLIPTKAVSVYKMIAEIIKA